MANNEATKSAKRIPIDRAIFFIMTSYLIKMITQKYIFYAYFRITLCQK